jgi:aminopeptidase N
LRHGDPSGADEYVPGHGDARFDVIDYDLELTYKVSGNHLTGVAALRLVALEDFEDLHLDLHGLRVSKLTVDGAAARYRHRRDRLVVQPGGRVRRGRELTIVVHYSGNPSPVSDRHLGTAGWEELSDGVIVASQPHGAPSWFPCNDRPSNKARYRITVTAPSEYHVVANGTLESRRRGASATTWSYDQPEPMATYLATVQIGGYEVRSFRAPVPLSAAVPARLLGGYPDAFGAQPKMLEAFIRRFGPYPFAGYSVVVTDDDLEIPLESQGLSTFGANFLRRDWDAVRLVAHEMAHQWFGNSLTLGSWRDIWLHEGFACYAEWIWSEESGGRSAHEQAVGHWQRLSQLDQDLELGDPGPDLMFDDRVYKRGALLLHALRLTVGDDVFFGLLQDWTSTYAQATVSTELFIALAEQHAGRPLDDLFRRWLKERSLPALPGAPRAGEVLR